MIEKRSYCRLCHGMCGMIVSIDGGRIAAVRGDKDNPLTRGYACIKGLQAPELHDGPGRLRQHQARRADGGHDPIAFDQAIDAIATRLEAIIAQHGPAAVAMYSGTQSAYNILYRYIGAEFMKALQSPSRFSSMTIDQSAKWVTAGRLGSFASGLQSFRTADVWLIAGLNPMVSLAGSSAGMPVYDPVKQLKEARARGFKLIVIDPVATQTAKNAALHLQPKPGEDPTIFASLLHIILREGWHDRDFCERYVNGLDALQQALQPFDENYAAARAGLQPEELILAARMFAHEGTRGCAGGGTGPNMAPHSNLAEHLIECMNVICGRYTRAGDEVRSPDLLHAARPVHAEVNPPTRSWERGVKGAASGLGTMNKEMMTATLADEILHPGAGSIRALFCVGANPANALPDQQHGVKALQALDLLVTSDSVWSHTARLADYVFAAKQPFERPDHTYFAEELVLMQPFAQYTPALVEPPHGADVIDDWYVYYALAQRMGLQLRMAGRDLDMTNTPTSDELLALFTERGQINLETLKQYPSGAMFDYEPRYVLPPRAEAVARFEVMPVDVQAELRDVIASFPAHNAVSIDGRHCTHLLIARRERELMNSFGRDLSEVRRRMPYNPAFLHPDDLQTLGLAEGARVRLQGEAGAIDAIVQADATLRRGVVAMSHGWGGLPNDTDGYEAVGASTTRLVARDRHVESINGMPRLTAIPVAIVAADAA
jgi:anaerobic selenocysteine-containing dehydrogenase